MDYLILITQWFTSLGINPNIEKLERQLLIIQKWFEKQGKGVLLAITGFGKTYVAIIAIYRLNLKYPEANVNVVVPSIKLYKDWLEHIETFNLKNVTVYVINTYTATYLKTGIKHKCFLLVIDELHNALGEYGIQFNQTITGTEYEMFFGMSATLEQREIDVLTNLNIPIIDEVTMSEGLRNNYISNYIIYNYGINLTGEEAEKYDRYNDIHNSNYAKFNYFPEGEQNWSLARACGSGNDVKTTIGRETRTGKQWRQWYADVMRWDNTDEHPWSPKSIDKYANQWNWAMRERKNFLYKHPIKLQIAADIINFLNIPTITFAETTEFADELVKLLDGKALAYHSNLKTGYTYEEITDYRKQLIATKNLARKFNGKIGNYEKGVGYPITYKKEVKIVASKLRKLALSKFEAGEIKVLCTAKALDEGFNVENIECAIICSASSKRRQMIQRMGRSLRFVTNKTAKIINIYIRNTQDETWLRKRQKGDTNIREVKDINEIITL